MGRSHRFFVPSIACGLAPLMASSLIACTPGTAVTITIHYSAFDPQEVRIRHGVPVTFVLVNDDPIDHEWIVGDTALHQRHRTGTEPVHGSRPTEISIPALTTRVTTITFREPGSFEVICHLPRHEEYGMVGRIIVI
jgi:uncharacterized cupredoxin-like copper-binding protein